MRSRLRRLRRWRRHPLEASAAAAEVGGLAVVLASESSRQARQNGEQQLVVTHRSAVWIRRPPTAVASYVFDPTTMPHWSGVLYEIEPTADIEPRLGRHLRATLKILGAHVTVEGELVDMDLAARWATVRVVPTSTEGCIEHSLFVEGSGDGTVLYFWNRIEVPGWLSSAVSDPVVERFVDQTATFALANIKAILEHGDEDNLRRLQVPADGGVPTSPRLDHRG